MSFCFFKTLFCTKKCSRREIVGSDMEQRDRNTTISHLKKEKKSANLSLAWYVWAVKAPQRVKTDIWRKKTQRYFCLTTKRNPLRRPSSILATDSPGRTEKFKSSITAIASDAARANFLGVEVDRTVSRSARESAARSRQCQRRRLILAQD